MKLLLDQNLSHKLVARLTGLFPGTARVRNIGMASADDKAIWDHAGSEDFTILSKDGDFHQLSLVLGAPPKVIWLRVGNLPTDRIADLMRGRVDEFEQFSAGEGALPIVDP